MTSDPLLDEALPVVDRFELVADDLMGPGEALRAGLAGLASRSFWRWYLLEAIPSVDAG